MRDAVADTAKEATDTHGSFSPGDYPVLWIDLYPGRAVLHVVGERVTEGLVRRALGRHVESQRRGLRHELKHDTEILPPVHLQHPLQLPDQVPGCLRGIRLLSHVLEDGQVLDQALHVVVLRRVDPEGLRTNPPAEGGTVRCRGTGPLRLGPARG